MNENYLNCIEGENQMWNIKEKDLDEFKITCRNRLSPERSMVFILGATVYSSLFMLLFLEH